MLAGVYVTPLLTFVWKKRVNKLLEMSYTVRPEVIFGFPLCYAVNLVASTSRSGKSSY